ncbi:G patch domain and ankyrin repeat-containing protein 1, partial [Globisporangium splendens]
MYFCAACNVYVKETSTSEHDQSTAHLLSTAKAPSLKKVWLPESNRGYRLLMNMGWQQDSGLGPTGAGRMDPVTTVFKTDRAGLGMQSTAKLARVTHFPAHNEQQQRQAPDGRSDAQRMQDRLARGQKRKQEQRVPSQAERKARRLQDQQRDRTLGRELYSTGLEDYEEFFQ